RVPWRHRAFARTGGGRRSSPRGAQSSGAVPALRCGAMITCRHYRQGELKEEAFDPTRVSDLLKEQDARLWLDIQDPTDDELRLIGEEFGLHPLSLEDAAHRGQRSKVDVFEGYLS